MHGFGFVARETALAQGAGLVKAVVVRARYANYLNVDLA